MCCRCLLYLFLLLEKCFVSMYCRIKFVCFSFHSFVWWARKFDWNKVFNKKKIKCNSKTVIQPPITLKITVNSFTKTKQRERKRKIKKNSDKKKTIMSLTHGRLLNFHFFFSLNIDSVYNVYGTPRQTIHIRMNLLCVYWRRERCGLFGIAFGCERTHTKKTSTQLFLC